MLHMIERERCVISKELSLDKLYTFKNFPIFMGVTDQDESMDKVADMDFVIAKDSGMIQLKKLIPSDELYKNSHNNSFGTIWDQHHREFAEFISRYQPGRVLEAGGGNGRLSLYYQEKFGDTEWVIIEPSPVDVLPGVKAEYIHGFFEASEEAGLPLSMDTIVHSHLLEHIYEPGQFIENCFHMLSKSGGGK